MAAEGLNSRSRMAAAGDCVDGIVDQV